MNTLARPVGRPKKENAKNVVFTVRLSQDEYDKLRRFAEATDTSLMGAIRDLIDIGGKMAGYDGRFY